MRAKLLFGIALVFCLQITFTLLIAVNRTEEEYFAMAKDPPMRISGGPQNELAALDDTQPAAAFRREKRSVIRATQTQTTERPVDTVKERDPKKTTVAVRQPPIRVFEPTSLANAKFSQPKRERNDRSLFAKALPVIKKPYDWVKTAASLFK